MFLYCAFACQSRPDWQTKIPVPKKPGNVGQKKWDEERLPEALKKMAKDAPLHYLGGYVNNVVTIADGADTVAESTAAEFVDFLSAVKEDVYLLAFDATKRFRQVLWTCTLAGKATEAWMWAGASENRYEAYALKTKGLSDKKLAVIDIESFAGAKTEKIGWDAMVEAWGAVPMDEGPNWTERHTAKAVRTIGRRMGFGRC